MNRQDLGKRSLLFVQVVDVLLRELNLSASRLLCADQRHVRVHDVDQSKDSQGEHNYVLAVRHQGVILPLLYPIQSLWLVVNQPLRLVDETDAVLEAAKARIVLGYGFPVLVVRHEGLVEVLVLQSSRVD